MGLINNVLIVFVLIVLLVIVGLIVNPEMTTKIINEGIGIFKSLKPFFKSALNIIADIIKAIAEGL